MEGRDERSRREVAAGVGGGRSRAAAVRTVCSGDDDLLANRDERRNASLETGFAGRFLELIGRGCALDAWWGVGDRQRDGKRQFDRHRLAIAPQHDDLGVGKYIQRQIADDLFGKFDLVVTLKVHEYRLATLVVEVLHGAAVKIDLLDIFARAQALLDQRTGLQIADLDLHERAKVARCAVLGLKDQKELAIHLDGHARAQVGAIHSENPLVVRLALVATRDGKTTTDRGAAGSLGSGAV